MPTALERFEEVKAAYKRIVEELGSEIMAEVFTPFWEAHPEVVAVRWTQYTPYFNDGDPCVFGVNEISGVKLALDAPVPEDSYVDDEDDDGTWYEGYSFGRRWNRESGEYDYEPIGHSLNELDGKLQSMQDILFQTFGDHAEITATRDAFDVAECNHD